MITIINFSHPLSAEACNYIKQEWGGGDAHILTVKVQVEIGQPLGPQVQAVLADAISQAGGNPLNIDCIIPPGLSPAAAMVARALPHAHLIVVARVGDSLPPKYMPVELIRSIRPGRPWGEEE